MDVIAIDVGGTTIKAAHFGPEGIRESLSRATPSDPDEALAAIAALALQLREPGTRAVGVVVPGVVDSDTGVVEYATNLGWRDVALRAHLQALLDLPVTVGHDVAAAATAEAGGAAGDLLFVALGTGIAAVHVQAGVAQRGATGTAGELGHVPIYPDGEPCRCGQRGCLEAYASAAAIARRYAAAGGDPDADARAIAARRDTDRVAAQVWQQAAEALGLALATATLLLDPALIVLGGGLSLAGDALLDPVRIELRDRLAWRSPPPVRVSELAAEAGLHGAALLARSLATTNPERCLT